MIEVYKNLFVGIADGFDTVKDNTEFVSVLACKEPFHRSLIGYTGKGCPKEHREYLFAERDNKLILNLVDVANVEYISPIIIDKAVNYIRGALCEDKKVFICCNKGESRSPTIALLSIATKEPYLGSKFDSAIAEFKKVYPQYNPNKGMLDYAQQNWNKYCFPF